MTSVSTTTLVVPTVQDTTKDSKSDRDGNVITEDSYDARLENPKYCNVCQLPFLYESWYKTHLASHKVGAHKCNYCPKIFNRKDSLIRHNQIHTGLPDIYKCKECDKAFTYKSSLHDHEKYSHETTNIGCTLCKKAFKNNKTLKYHINNVHTLLAPYKCPTCNMTFAAPYQKYRHRKKLNH
ncbi:Hypothetical protein CINCED_3A014879 [Cinara cedri]|nr:Hypothetical protein CINCED_3A014879 [Cinara cedri]